MIDKTLSYLDFKNLIDYLRNFSVTPYINQSLEGLKPLNSIEDIKIRQDKIEALLEIIKWDGAPPLYNNGEITEIIKRLAIKDVVLELKEIVLIADFLRSCHETFNFLKKAHKKEDFIIQLIERIKPLKQVHQKIVKTINPECFIEDTATYELSRIRTELYIHREKIRKLLERIMEREQVRPIVQDTYIALRNNRYVLPLKPNFNQVLKGIVHDYSHTLKTSFVEPMECVELNNTINILENEEKEEEKRILKDLTAFIAKYANDLEENLEVIKELDLYTSIALFSIQFNCVRPEITQNGELDIKDAVNPFIYLTKKEKTVPIDITLKSDKRAMIISGPNAGGKTAALKTIGLISAMALSGLFIPAKGKPKVPFFSGIFAIIGDEQDISMELSSFTAHMMTITELYNKARGNELILIDEIGGNTEPQEASAISMAIIDTFVEKGSKVIVTTHLNLLKSYGYTKPFAINVATDFDYETMTPRYKLNYGLAGYSNAINVAKKISVPSRIIEKSYEYLDSQEFMLNELISSLRQKKEEAERELNAAIKIREDLKKRILNLKEKREEYLKNLEEKVRQKIEEIEAEITSVMKEISKRDKASVEAAKKRIEIIKKTVLKETETKKEDVKKGDYVKVKSLGIRGRIVDIDEKDNTVEIVTGNLRTKVKTELISKLPVKEKEDVKEENRKEIQIDYESIEEPQINIMGMRVDEALKTLDKFVDRALIQGMPRVKVLHGIGTGRLMNAVKEHFSKTDFVKGIKRDERNTGITILELA